MNASAAVSPATRAAACRRVADWTREHFALPADAIVLVSERANAQPGFPPLETLLVFWGASLQQPAQRHHYRFFKPVHEVQPDDLPPAWMKDALAEVPAWACDCC